jgi:xeroderma pigmentosum group C-complementing protein
MKRCSLQSEVNRHENTASNSLEKKRRRLETKVESKSAKNINENSTYNTKQQKAESSDSSSDEFMRAPLLSDFDRVPVKEELTSSDFTAIENNILTGVTCLSDSEDSDFDGDSINKSNYSPIEYDENVAQFVKTDRKKKARNSNKSRIKSEQRNASTESPKIEKGKMKGLSAPDINKMDVSQLLALGEASGTTSKVHTAVMDRAHNLTSDSENGLSDWEDVEGLDVKPTEHIIPKEGIEVTLEVPDLYRKRKKKGFDMEAHLRRRLNRVKREFQVLIHKVHLLCWIAHGRYVNSVLNSEVLMAQSLSLIPSQHCYPSKHANLSYLEHIVEWFRQTVNVSDGTENKPLLPLCESLQQSFQLRTACSTRDLVLMFICILRTLGIKARLMMSLQPLPLKPSSQELCVINKTKEKKKSDQKEDAAGVKVENTDTGDASPAETSKTSLNDRKKCLKSKRSESTSKLQAEKPVEKKCKKSNEKSSNSNLKSKTHNYKPLKGPRSDGHTSDEKTDKMKRTLRTRKERRNMYKDRSDSSDEDDTSRQEIRVSCKKKQSSKTRISSDGHPHKGYTDVHLINERKSFSKMKERGSTKGVKTAGFKTKRGNLSQTASSIKQEANSNSDSDSDFFPESLSCQKSCDVKRTESVDSNSESDFESKKAPQKKKSTNRRAEGRQLTAPDSGMSANGKASQKKKKCCDVWTEVFLEEEEKWISVDVQSGKLHCVAELHVSHFYLRF